MIKHCIDFFNNKEDDEIMLFYEKEEPDNILGPKDLIYVGTKILFDTLANYDGVPLEEPIVLIVNLPDNVHQDYGQQVQINYQPFQNLDELKAAIAEKLENMPLNLMNLYMFEEEEEGEERKEVNVNDLTKI